MGSPQNGLIVIDCVMCYGALNPLGVAILKWELDAYFHNNALEILNKALFHY